jgi:WD40 repeat protein
VAAGSGEGGAVLEAIAVLKGHVSSVTDLVFTGDDKRLVSTGAGGAVYFWDLSTGTRLTELEYVDKKCIYCSGVLEQAVQCITQRAALCTCLLRLVSKAASTWTEQQNMQGNTWSSLAVGVLQVIACSHASDDTLIVLLFVRV